MRRGRIAAAALGLVLGVALALPAGAWAHASLVDSTPGIGARVDVVPHELVLHFSEHVDALRDSIVVVDANGRVVSGVSHTRADDHFVVAPLDRLHRGGYTVRWKAISRDGHVGRGVFTFGVRTAAPPVTDAYGASGPTTSEHIVRWLYFLALALLIGGLGFRLAILPRDVPAATERRFYRITGVGVVAALEVGVLAFLLRAEDALQLPLTGFLYGDLTPLADGTRFGKAFVAMTLGFAAVAALLFLAWLTERRFLLWGALVLSLGLASGLSLSGHQSDDPGWLSELADWVHLSAGTLWIGGVLMLGIVVWPTAPELRRSAFWRFSQVAGVLVAIVVAAGIFLGFKRLPALADLWDASYGRLLLLKIGLACLALAWGAFHHLVVRPRLDRSYGLLSRTLLAEGAVGAAILLVAAILVDSKPPTPTPAPKVAVPVLRK
jgi:copper transport protein